MNAPILKRNTIIIYLVSKLFGVHSISHCHHQETLTGLWFRLLLWTVYPSNPCPVSMSLTCPKLYSSSSVDSIKTLSVHCPSIRALHLNAIRPHPPLSLSGQTHIPVTRWMSLYVHIGPGGAFSQTMKKPIKICESEIKSSTLEWPPTRMMMLMILW